MLGTSLGADSSADSSPSKVHGREGTSGEVILRIFHIPLQHLLFSFQPRGPPASSPFSNLSRWTLIRRLKKGYWSPTRTRSLFCPCLDFCSRFTSGDRSFLWRAALKIHRLGSYFLLNNQASPYTLIAVLFGSGFVIRFGLCLTGEFLQRPSSACLPHSKLE